MGELVLLRLGDLFMKQKLIFGSFSVAICAAVVMVLLLLQHDSYSSAIKIGWSPVSIRKTIGENKNMTESVSIGTSQTINNVDIVIEPEISNYVYVAQKRIPTIPANQEVQIELHFKSGDGTPTGTYRGRIILKQNGKTIGNPFPLIIVVTRPNEGKTPSMGQDDLQRIREEVAKVGDTSLRYWLGEIPKGDLKRYGFSSGEEALLAKTLTPIPYYTPSREREKLKREYIEKQLEKPPPSWLIPVAVEQRIVCLIMVDAPTGKQPEAVEFGKTFAANRLDAAIRTLKLPGEAEWRQLRFLSFVEPPVDILISGDQNGNLRWFNLLGTSEPEVSELRPEDISNVLNDLSL